MIGRQVILTNKAFADKQRSECGEGEKRPRGRNTSGIRGAYAGHSAEERAAKISGVIKRS